MALSSPAFFTQALLRWNRQQNSRQMPWKNESDPYRIWLSEIMLQQTRVEQGWPYYLRFIERFPTVEWLAAAPDDEVFKLWEGLGYYSRCRNLLHTARQIVAARQGVFPKTYQELLALKGVGAYTAAAIASFAYNLPHAVVDGNVVRLLARYFGVEANAQTSGGKRTFEDLAQALLPQDCPAEFNQAIMDFGATVCMPRLPLCTKCPLKSHCIALQQNRVMELPAKKTALAKRHRFFRYAIIQANDHIMVRQRQGRDIWQGLYEFVLTEAATAEDWNSTCGMRVAGLRGQHKLLYVQTLQPQELSHQKVFIRLCWYISTAPEPVEGYQWKLFTDLERLAFPRSLQGVWRHLAEGNNPGSMAADPGESYG